MFRGAVFVRSQCSSSQLPYSNHTSFICSKVVHHLG